MAEHTRKLTRRQKRLQEKALVLDCNVNAINHLHFELKEVSPMTETQEQVFNSYQEGANLFLYGCAGSGKSFISMYLALKDLQCRANGFNKIVIIRSAQPGKQIGFLPGTEKQKLEVYEAPYKAICSELYHRDDAYDILKKKNLLEFTGTSFLRGTTIDNSIILVDEVQNMTYQELRTVITRVGEYSRIIFCGDTKQDDLTSERYKETSGLQDLMRVFDKMNQMRSIQFTVDDIVRSGLVKDFIIAEYELGLY